MALGISNVIRHRPGLGYCAGVIAGINLLSWKTERLAREHQVPQFVRQLLQQQQFQQIQQLGAAAMDPQVFEMAERHLAMVVKAVGAARHSDVGYGVFFLNAGGRRFWIECNQVWTLDRNGDKAEGTCILQMHMMPPQEHIASMLLALHADPYLFFRWKQMDGGHI